MEGRGDPLLSIEALSTALAEHLPRVYAYAFRLGGSADVAEDLTQQAYLVAQQRLHQLRDRDRLVSWLLRIVRNLFLKSCRRRVPLSASQLDIEVDQVIQAEVLESSCDEEQVRRALAQLPDDYRTVVLMFYFEELSYREIADELGIPAGTVMSRLSRAKSHLRRLLGAPAPLSR